MNKLNVYVTIEIEINSKTSSNKSTESKVLNSFFRDCNQISTASKDIV